MVTARVQTGLRRCIEAGERERETHSRRPFNGARPRPPTRYSMLIAFFLLHGDVMWSHAYANALLARSSAFDGARQQYLSQPSQFRPSHLHTDVRLVLGWLSSFIAIGAAGYAWQQGRRQASSAPSTSSFQETRPIVLAAVVVFALLQGVAGAYARWIEGDVVFVGRRKMFAGRVSSSKWTQARRRTSGLERSQPEPASKGTRRCLAVSPMLCYASGRTCIQQNSVGS